VSFHRGVYPVERVSVRRQRGQHLGQVLAHVLDARPHDLFDQVLAGRKVVVDGRRLYFRLIGHVGEPGPGVALAAQDVRGRSRIRSLVLADLEPVSSAARPAPVFLLTSQ
jgi:hypothetical protein